MWPPLLRILLDEPALIFGHVAGYTALIHQETTCWQARLKRRIRYFLLLVGSGLLALLFAGIALMLYAVTGISHWLLWAVPGAPLFGLIVASWGLARELPVPSTFPRLRSQFDKDLQLFGLKEDER